MTPPGTPGAVRTSVVIPALDAWATLSDVLEALRPQVERGDREALLVDSSGAVSVADLRRRWPWIRVLTLPEPTLPGRARNIGAEAAAGEWLAFLDADCVPESSWLDRLEASLTASLDAVAGGIVNGTPRSPIGTTGYLLEFADWNPEARHSIRHAASCNLLMRRAALERMGGFPEDVFPGEDTILTVPIAAAGRLGFAPGARVRHINRTNLAEFLSHQLRFGRSFPQICARSEFPHRSLGRPLLGPLAGIFRLLALGWRVIGRPRLALTALALLPLIALGLAVWTVGLTTSGSAARPRARRLVAEGDQAPDPISARPEGILVVMGSVDQPGGLQTRIARLADRLARDRPVTILTWAGRRRPTRSRRESGVRVVRLPSLGSWDREYRFPARHVNAVLSVCGGLLAATALRRSWRVAYASGLSGEGVVAALAASLLRRRFFLETWLPGERGNVARLQRSPLREPVKRVLRGASAVIAGTDELAEEITGCGFSPASVRVVESGIPLDEFVPATSAARARARSELGIPAESGLVVYHGRFDLRQKRLDLLLDAWRRARIEGWQLLLVGDGAGKGDLERLGRDVPALLPLHSWRDDVRPVLAAADLFVLPTEAEAPGTAMIEAMACGLAGAVSATPWYRQQRPAGIELVPNDLLSWAEALRRLTGDPAGRAERGAQARRWVEQRYDIERTIDTLQSILDPV